VWQGAHGGASYDDTAGVGDRLHSRMNPQQRRRRRRARRLNPRSDGEGAGGGALGAADGGRRCASRTRRVRTGEAGAKQRKSGGRQGASCTRRVPMRRAWARAILPTRRARRSHTADRPSAADAASRAAPVPVASCGRRARVPLPFLAHHGAPRLRARRGLPTVQQGSPEWRGAA
jgi:hypothetical protein